MISLTMKIVSYLTPNKTLKKPPNKGPSDTPRDSFSKSLGNFAGKAARKLGRYSKPAVIAAAPALATAAALALGGVPAAGIAMLASMGVGAVAGAATWGKDIGLLRGLAGGGLVGAFSAGLGALSGPIGVTYMATLGATRQVLLDTLP